MFEVLEGDGYLHVEGSTIKMSKGETYKILKGEKHFMSPRENSKLKILVSYIDY
jgi:quercetin dioxygenase-like cupin family protein